MRHCISFQRLNRTYLKPTKPANSFKVKVHGMQYKDNL